MRGSRSLGVCDRISIVCESVNKFMCNGICSQVSQLVKRLICNIVYKKELIASKHVTKPHGIYSKEGALV